MNPISCVVFLYLFALDALPGRAAVLCSPVHLQGGAADVRRRVGCQECRCPADIGGASPAVPNRKRWPRQRRWIRHPRKTTRPVRFRPCRSRSNSPHLWALLTHPWVFVGWFAVLWFAAFSGGGIDHCGSDRFVAVSGRGGFMRGAAALSWSTRSGRPALPAVVAREPPQGSPRQSADLTRTPGPRCSRCSAWWGSGASGQCGPVAAEGEHRQGDERFGGVEAERDAGQHPDLGVGGFDQPLR